MTERLGNVALSERDALVDALSLDVEDALVAVSGCATRLLHQERHRVGFVHQAQFARLRRLAAVAWVHEQTAADQNAMNFRDQGCDPSHVEVPFAQASFARQTLDHIALDGRFPEASLISFTATGSMNPIRSTCASGWETFSSRLDIMPRSS